MEEAEQALDCINACLADLLPRSATPPVDSPSTEQAAAKAQQLVEAAEAVQRALSAFAAGPAPTPAAALQREVQALETELQAAESLVCDVEARLARWQGTCERLRGAHAAALTDGI